MFDGANGSPGEIQQATLQGLKFGQGNISLLKLSWLFREVYRSSATSHSRTSRLFMI